MGLDGAKPFAASPNGRVADADAQVRRNVLLECAFNLMGGVFVGMIFYASPVVAETCLTARGWHIALILCAFPAGAFLAPLWARLSRQWGLQGMVLRMAILGNVPLLFVPLVERQSLVSPATAFATLMTISLLLYSAMKMGQSSLYRSTYPAAYRGRVLGWLLFCNYASMVPATLGAGWLIDQTRAPGAYRWMYPLTAIVGMSACLFYARIRPLTQPRVGENTSIAQTLRQVGRVLRRDHDYRWFQIGFFLSGSAFFMSFGVILKLCHLGQGFSAEELALLLGALPLAVLALSSPLWGWTLDRIGIIWQRVLVAIIMTLYLTCYFLGLVFEITWLIYLGSVLRGVSEGGGQVTWQLASVQFAPSAEEVPTYNSIHFTLNGIRGLVMPWVGLRLMGWLGPWTIAVAVLVSAVSIFTGMNLAQRKASDLPPEPPPLGPEE